MNSRFAKFAIGQVVKRAVHAAGGCEFVGERLGRVGPVERLMNQGADQSACDGADDRLAPEQASNQVLKQLAAARAFSSYVCRKFDGKDQCHAAA